MLVPGCRRLLCPSPPRSSTALERAQLTPGELRAGPTGRFPSRGVGQCWFRKEHTSPVLILLFSSVRWCRSCSLFLLAVQKAGASLLGRCPARVLGMLWRAMRASRACVLLCLQRRALPSRQPGNSSMLLGDWAPWVLEAPRAAAELLCPHVLCLGPVSLVPLPWQCAAQQLAPSRCLRTIV